ncbi:unnamed protein product [Meloidogyne enterolobii]|uniref:Uncharacterized protein n=1 Tax=Meloidogyne enterolobii TaxID=390850 RepID=A0ACB0YNR2_MELEN
MEFLTLMTWGVEDGVPFIPEPLPVELAQPELVIVDEEPEPAAPTVGEENACEAKEEQKVYFLQSPIYSNCSRLHQHLVFLLK